jgi:predicted nucleic acid-binding protein
MICVDASLAVKWLFPEEEDSDKALALLTAQLAAGEPIVEPPLLRSEVTNAIRQRMRREGVQMARALQLLEQFLAVPLTFEAPERLSRDALMLADAHQLPAVYDAHYVALAQLVGCDLWTADQRLVRGLGRELPFVKWLGDFAPADATGSG